MNVECVILAGGFSSRIGQNKMLLEIKGKTVIERCISAFYGICSRIIVVTGRYHADIEKHLKHYKNISIVYNENYCQGMFSSVKAGVKRVKSERFFITPGDYPLLQSDTIQQMLLTNRCFCAPVYQNKQGHPVLLHNSFIPIILNSKEESLRDCLEKMSVYKQLIHVDNIGVVTDMDTSEAYAQILKRY